MICKKKKSNDNEKYETISLWMDNEMFFKIEEIAQRANRTMDEIINIFIECGLDNYQR